MKLPTGSRMAFSLVFVMLFLSALVLSGCSKGNAAATITQAAPPATVSVAIKPSAVMPGQSATLSWSSTNAAACTASGTWSGTLATSGSMTVILQGAAAQGYTLTCSGNGLPAQYTATLAVRSDAGCTTAQAVRSHRARFTPATAAARRAVANGTAGVPRKSH